MLSKWAFTTALCLGTAGAWADPGYYVVTPYDDEGVRKIDLRYWTVKPRGGVEVVWPEIGFGYGVTSRWSTTLFMSWIGSSQMPMRQSTLNWQNSFLLTQGELPFDLALHGQWIRHQGGAGGHSVEFGPALQTDIGRTQLNFNAFFERGFGPRAARPAQLKYQWQLRHRWQPQLHFGAQGFGELGAWNDWAPGSAQSHRAGPALFGSFRLGERELFKVQGALLAGKTYGRTGHMFTLRAHHEF